MIQNKSQYGYNRRGGRGHTRPGGHHPNVGETERLISVLGGGVLALAGLSRRSLGGTLLAAAGGYLAYRGATGNCAVYRGLGLSTADDAYAVSQRRGVRVEESVIVNTTPEALYTFWRKLENLPRFLRHIEEVEDLGNNRSHWRTKGPAGLDVSWDAEIVGDIENELISWRSLPGAVVPNAGAVRFRAMPGGQSTVMRVSLTYNPPGGAVGAAVARVFGEAAGQQVSDDLHYLKGLIERGEIPDAELRSDASRTFGRDSGGRASQDGAFKDKVSESQQEHPDDLVDEALKETFPTSDPPSYSPGRAGSRPDSDSNDH